MFASAWQENKCSFGINFSKPMYRETIRNSDGFIFYTRMKTTPICLTKNVTATIFRPRGLFFVCLVWVAFPMSIKGDFVVGLAQGNVLMSWKTNVTDILFIRFVVNATGVNPTVNIIRFNANDVTGTAVSVYSSKVTEIGNVSLGRVSFRLLSLTVADAGRYYYKIAELNSADGGQVLVIAGIPVNITVMEMSDPLENEMYTMKCSAQSASVPLGMGLTMHYQWKRENGQNITASDRYSFSSNQSNLIINPLKKEDNGTVVCEAWEHVGAVSQSAPFSLKVIYGPYLGNIQLSPNGTSHEVSESSSLFVNCSTDCFPDCQYSWTGPDGLAKINTSMLSIISVGRNQAGQYICTASNSRIRNNTASLTITVVVFYGPDDRNVSLSPSNTSYKLIEMSRLDVKCSATCIPQCNYQWSGPLVSQNDTTGSLSISQISRNQTGTFSCSVTNPKISGKPATANVSVIVYYGPNTNGLTLSPSNTSYQLKELSPLIVNCSASCVPQCNYQWMGPGITQNDSRGLLSISQISRNQTGMFACIVNNPMIPGKSVTANFSVKVYYGPDAPLILYPVTTSYRDIEGTFITNITCSADCNPPCNYQWIGPLGATSSGVLSLGTYDRIKRGSYFCMATNPRTSTSFNGSTIDMVVIYGPDMPYLSPSTTVYTKLEGESVLDINCSADCFPGCTQVWMKGCSAVQESNGKILSLTQVTREKAGDYTCWFNNTESRATGHISIKLIVQYPPVLTMKATNTSKGGRVVINCTASGVPNNYTFYKLTHMAPDVNRTIVRELELTRVSNSDVSFTIENATYQDTGFYVCKASNGITHYSTRQLVMEDIVSVWITDLPVITSDAQQFDAEKGKTGHLYIEFYSGLFQPLVTWYIDKNGTMELLQNSSHFRIYLSAVTVELKYYQQKIQLPGYTASLEVYDVNDEQFASYRVEINNSFTEQSCRTIELKPRVIENKFVDQNVSPVIIGAATGSALLLVIAVAVVGFLFYKRKQTTKSCGEDVDALQDDTNLSDDRVSGLKDNPVYDSSGPLPDPSTKEGATGDEYATVVKPKKQGVQVEDSKTFYAQIDQTKKGKKKGQAKEKHGKVPRGDIYENVTLAGRDNFKGNMYANSGDLKADENVYENPKEEDSRGMAKKDGLMYADLMLDTPTMKNGKYVIRGLDNRTEYADIAFGKRGEPLPDNNEEKI